VSADYVLKIDSEKIREMPMVDLAYELLKTANTPFYYRDLMMEIAKMRGLSQEQVTDVIAQLYTEINIDGRFACVGGNVWGLKRWYPVERADDQLNGGAKRPRIINDDDDDDDLYGEDDDAAVADDDSYGLFDEETDEVFEEGEEAAESDDEVLIEDDEEAEIDEEIEAEEEEDDFEEDEEAGDDEFGEDEEDK